MSDEGPSTNEFEVGTKQLTRRRLLATGAGGLAAVYGLGASGASAASESLGAALDSGTVTLGSYETHPGIEALAAATKKFTANTGIKVKTNTVDHNTFQNQINSYLQGKPDDVFTWFAGYRMQFFAAKGLATPIDDVWKALTPQMPPSIKAASTGIDGHQYLVPNKNYPWAVYYRKSLWKEKGYTVPTTWDQYIALAKKMQTDGLTPIAFTDKDGWPAMGTFDYLNMRVNGYQFHVDLMAHKESWTSPKVAAVFDNWKSILPFHDTSALGLTWQESAQKIAGQKAGMYLLGSFVTQQFTNPKVLADVDFFPFPIMTEANGQDALEAPIDGFMLSKKGGDNKAARALLAYLGSPEGQNTYAKVDTANVATNLKADFTSVTPLQKKAQQTIADAKEISQFLDRDALPAFANNVMIPALQTFFKSGSFDQTAVESQAKSLYASQ